MIDYNGAMLVANRVTRTTRLAVLSLLPILAGCAGGEEVTVQSIDKARRLWEQAGIRDYDLEWTSSGSGMSNSHYRVEVRGSEVRSIQMVQPDGSSAAAHPGEPRFYGVEGLFTVIKDDLTRCSKPEPFGQAKGTKVILRFTPDPKFGFPRRYRRDVLGASQALAIDVIRFEQRNGQLSAVSSQPLREESSPAPVH